ncbi:hypothetical protein BB561_003356 [Smittium simulii]|uniref:SAC domain-containing protein n=1 Tax=Smittium simulii TaxID=133385 RepID=A0A2T9YLU1_9FUNG|nr:hypothetical protein BB561_003356 [Smittium simulii]
MSFKSASENNLFQFSFFKDFVLIQNIQKEKDVILEINSFGAVKILDAMDNVPKSIKIIRGYGIFGLIKLISGYYIIVITERIREGFVDNKIIYRVAKTEIYKIGFSDLLTPRQSSCEKGFLENIKLCLNIKNYYFSYNYDLTNSLQSQRHSDLNYFSWENANSEFFFNSYLCHPLILASNELPRIENFILPVINGYFMTKKILIKNTELTVTLITRRSKNNQGARFFCRGVDKDGNVANYAETEQILEFYSFGNQESEKFGLRQNEKCSVSLSLLQIRGSAPFKWAQVICGKYKPKLIVDSFNADGFIKHTKKILHNYNKVAVINLVDKKKYEMPIAIEFQRLVDTNNLENLTYFHYDFHSESKKNKLYKKDDLLEQTLQDILSNFGCYRKINYETPRIIELQQGIARTNCMDCLDRTNVIQSKLAFMWIQNELRHYGLILPSETFSDFSEAEYILRNLWADNADFLSLAYSGTPALKTDITRTGIRTLKGAFSDGLNSALRYFIGCYYDGFRQDSIDIFFGKYRVPILYTSDYDFKTTLIKRVTNTIYPYSLAYILNWPTLAPYLYSIHVTNPMSELELPTPYSINMKKPLGKIK